MTLTALLGALVLMRRGRRGAASASAAAETLTVDVPVETDVVEVAEVVEAVEPAELVETAEVNDVRALRAQVRALEQALELAPESAVPAVVGSTDGEAAYRNQVLLAVRAVASRTGADDDPRHAAARVVAAVERLDVDGFKRPVLPGIASRSITAPPPLPPAQPAVIAPTPAPQILLAGPDVDHRDDVEVVVPVPPPAAEEPRRGRRRLRRHGASDAA